VETFQIRPLQVVKQIMTMSFSQNAPKWRERHPELEQFIHKRTLRGLDPKYRVFAYYNLRSAFRRIGEEMAIMEISEEWRVKKVTEIAHPPLGYVLVTDGQVPSSRLTEISEFVRMDPDRIANVPLAMPVLETNLPIPLDYRDSSEMIRDYWNSVDQERLRKIADRERR